MPRCRRRRCSELLLIATLLVAGAARADEPGEVDAYKAAVARGAERFNAGEFAAARAEFTRAYAIHPVPVLLFNLASCHRRAGEYEQALAAYERFVAAAPDDDGRVPLARETIEDLRALLAERAEVEAAERAAEEPPLAPPPVVPDQPAPVVRRAPEWAHPPAPPRRGVLARRVGVGMIAAGALALGAGAWQASRAADAEAAIERLPDGVAWDDDQSHLYQQGRSAATRALVLGIGGAALAAGGVALYVVGRRMGERPRRITVAAALTPGRAALVLGGRF